MDAYRNEAHDDHHRPQINLVITLGEAKSICSLCRVHVVYLHRQVYRTLRAAALWQAFWPPAAPRPAPDRPLGRHYQSPGIEFSWTRFWAKVLAKGVFDGKKDRSYC